ncbi:lamin tail domain-containing protein [Lysobacter auxotrophicus]|uniref:Lamin tail domain-containing protein n=1 Tax=Lysobacter auxotrophicus TaxID=2992573 RepID=A0ABM8DA14_9GAMM|nr:lamin tail domain-containing protein [Lysobacter auxotrophicus]BDU15418.1 lamin tail domain-containing protein [Lysobacter auxotrophicus]
MDRVRGRCAAALFCFASLLATGAAQAQVVISQVYGGGGGGTAVFANDYVELYNRGATPASLAGMSVQYASATGTGTFGGVAVLPSVTVQPGKYFLVAMSGGSAGAPLPTPDATGPAAMAAGAGKVALVRQATALACNGGSVPCSTEQRALIADLVGYGNANFFEGAGAAPTLTAATAALRNGNGATDTDQNNADFTAGTPTPRNSGSTTPEPEPATPRTIAQIQGSGLRSPHEGERVVTEGIVTALKFNNGFFLQAANDDGDAATSDGVFVFTSSAPPASAAVGNRVRVTGKVEEFVPASNVNQLTITEITGPTVELLETGIALPAPVELTAADLSPNATPGTLERLEGMRVSVGNAVVVGPSEGRIDEDDATASSDGVFYVTLPDVPTPFREPGIGVMDAALATLPQGKNPPLFDTNPERLMVRSRGQVGAFALSVDTGADVAGLLGVLDYFGGTWALLPDTATPPTAGGGRLPQAVNDALGDEVTIGGFNLLRFFDEIDDNNGAPTIKPEALDKRLTKTAGAICDYLKTPDILGVVEVENLRVLGLLAERINANCASAPQYVPYLSQGNDVGGINVGFLVATRAVGAGVSRVEVRDVVQFGKDATLANPDGSTSLLNDRPPLRLRANVHHANGAVYPVSVVVNHLRSLGDIDSVAPGSNGWSTDGARVRAKRGAQAAYLAGLVQQWQANDPAGKIVLVGDFNAFEFNDGYVDVLGVIKGTQAPEDQVLTYVDSPVTTPLIDGSELIADPAQRWSYVFGGNAQTLDHALVNEAVVMDASAVTVEHARINAGFAVTHYGDASVPLRVSDHDPVRIAIRVPQFRSADLSVTASATPATLRAGETATWTATVRNAGPDAADATAAAFAFDANVTPAIDVPAGWTCAAPVHEATTTSVACTLASLASQQDATFTLRTPMPALSNGTVVRMAVAARSQTRDPANADNDTVAQVTIVTAADLSVRIEGGVLPVRRGAIATFLVPVRNAGPDAAQKPTLTIDGNVAASAAAVAAPSGWTCTRVATATGFRAQCSRIVDMAQGVQWFAFAIVVPERPRVGTELEFAARVASDTPDPDASDNTDTLRVAIRR